jgi:hypothetical protein
MSAEDILKEEAEYRKFGVEVIGPVSEEILYVLRKRNLSVRDCRRVTKLVDEKVDKVAYLAKV